jgi:superfamily I DNA and/or RNA helicase
MLAVDEASMMVFPHFLALATLVAEGGEIMLAGDHRQLAPITAHDWEDEDRPPVEVYRPFVSAYEAVRRLRQDEDSGLSDQMMLQSELSYTHRLPAAVRSVVGVLYEDLDDVELGGAPFQEDDVPDEESEEPLATILGGPSRLCLLRHSERYSRQSNELEATLIRRILEASPTQLDNNSVAIVTPHRAQRSLLRDRLSDFSDAIQMIETVEKVQGAGIPIVIVSATVSDPTAISKRADFLLDLNRANVAFSRSEDRLIVVSSSTLMDHLPVELDQYESSMLWKIVRDFCSERRATLNINGEVVEVLTPSLPQLQSIG